MKKYLHSKWLWVTRIQTRVVYRKKEAWKIKKKMTKKGKTGEEAEYRRIKAKERKGFFENKNLSRRVERKRLKEA